MEILAAVTSRTARPLRRTLLLLGLCGAQSAFGVDVEAQGTLVRRTSFERPEDGYTSVRAGGSLAGLGYGFWGFAEDMRTERQTMVKYGEFAAIRAFGDWSLTAAGGGGNDERYKASSMILGEVARHFSAAGTTLLVGYTHSAYNYVDPDLYAFYRIGWQQKLGEDYRVQAIYQLVENHTASGILRRLGSALSVEAAATSGSVTGSFGASGSCLAVSVGCRGGPPHEDYAEVYAEGRLSVAATYGFSGRVGYIVETDDLEEVVQTAGAALPTSESFQTSNYHSLQVSLGFYRRL